MTLEECYKILQANEGQSIEEIKSHYRRLAFQYHPDLNPDDRNASRKFQRLNEAYVILQKYLENGERPSGPRTSASRPKGPQAARNSSSGTYDAQGRARATSEQAKASSGTASGSSTYRRTESTGPNFHYRQEEVLKDILQDPFARKVFEDIYAQVHKHQGTPANTSAKTRRLDLKWGENKLSLDLSKGVFGTMKSWMRGQLDDEHTAYYPASHLYPGRPIRIRVQQGFSRKEKTVEVTLPNDFVIGKPIRLRGLGRKLGPIKGDLYLRLLPK
ncbi:MAG: J domain-containing protein [Desulfovibrio sp.]|uniref:J domain-containing protein n=1 Tax=Desulfovibrio sp. 7SRBS1 TaxID=3378064 RepID=UPI003B408620